MRILLVCVAVLLAVFVLVVMNGKSTGPTQELREEVGRAAATPQVPLPTTAGYWVFAYSEDGSFAGSTAVPGHKASEVPFDEFRLSVANAACSPTLARENPSPDPGLRAFCQALIPRECLAIRVHHAGDSIPPKELVDECNASVTKNTEGRVIFTASSDDPLPETGGCILLCVCEDGRVSIDARSREFISDGSGCVNRVNCELVCGEDDEENHEDPIQPE